MEETSLDDFRDASGDADAARADPAAGTDDDTPQADPAAGTDDETAGLDAEADGDAEAEGDVGDSPLESPTVTAVWSPAGEPCEACGETVHRRWRDGDALVCRACTDW